MNDATDSCLCVCWRGIAYASADLAASSADILRNFEFGSLVATMIFVLRFVAKVVYLFCLLRAFASLLDLGHLHLVEDESAVVRYARTTV